ncbi:odorant receptor 44 [Nasonia vitripennis]|uniref:Odorant receptor n=1 Tax=Nasonia vitripennis TaxID=7425 RepID=A0A7M6UW61_NASVI|nr:odorant receptor 44 [Nasonia vitripennis]
MAFKISPEKAFTFTKLSVFFTAIWPPNCNDSSFKIKLANIFWIYSIISAMCLLIPMLASVLVYKDNPMIVSKSICLSCAVIQVIAKAIVCRHHQKKLQFLVKELTHFLKKAKKEERQLIEKYINRRAIFHMTFTLCCFGSSFFVICGPIFLPFSLPADAVYPFSVNSSPIWEIIYVHQASVGIQASSGMCVDNLVAYILWYTGVRFESLYYKFKHIKDSKEMLQCIKEHQYLLRYGTTVADTFRYVIFTTVLSVTAGLAFAGIYLFSPQPIFVKGQFVVVSISVVVNLYVTALPSNNLISMCHKVGDVVYESLWVGDSPSIMKHWIFIIQRCQKPVVIAIPGLIKELSLQFYSSVLCSTFSYFSALHVIMTKE